MAKFSYTLLLSLALTTTSQAQVTLRQQNFPTALPVSDETIEWQRDIYREINLTENENAGLYCPQEPTANQKGLFTRIFDLVAENIIPAYRYNIDGNEVFDETTKISIRDILLNHHIFFEEEDGRIAINRDDIPASNVMTYYIKEGVYYDLTNSAFRIRVLAICPVLIQDDDFSNGATKYPLFWIEYNDVEPYLKDLTIIPDYNNKATVMAMSDYFIRNLYKGNIYKVSNALGRTLRQTVESDSALVIEQQRIEQELRRIRKTTYNTYYEPFNVTNKQQDNENKRGDSQLKSESTKKDSEQ